MPETVKPVIAKLAAEHDASAFDCGQSVLNTYLQRYALAELRANSAQTYVAVTGRQVVGFHSLVVGEVGYLAAPERLVKGLPRHTVPIMVLARLAVDQTWQGRGLGAALVVDAMRRTLQAADIAGIRALLVHAKDAAAQDFYSHLGFEPFPDEPLVLYRLLKDLRTMAGS